MASSNYQYVITSGLIVPSTGAVMNEVIAEYQAQFGADLITTPNTPQGLLIIAETLARIAVINNNCAIANQINPNIAGGVYLSSYHGVDWIRTLSCHVFHSIV